MRARARAPPIAVHPVDAVVLALPARLGPVGHLIPLETLGFERGGDHLIAPGQHVLIRGRKQTLRYLAGHTRAIFHDERIRADVIHPGLQGTLQGQGHIRIFFCRRAINHVQVDVLEARIDGFARRIEGPARRVGSLQHGEHPRGGGLHAQGKAGEAGVEKPSEVLRRGGFRVGFRGDLRARGQAKGVANLRQDTAQTVRAQQARRATANKNRLGLAPHLRRRHLQFLLQSSQIIAGQVPSQLTRGIGVEVAVAAAGGTERNVNVETKGIHGNKVSDSAVKAVVYSADLQPR